MLSARASKSRLCELLVMSLSIGMPRTIPDLAGQTRRNYGM
jgi:hypothetical protein